MIIRMPEINVDYVLKNLFETDQEIEDNLSIKLEETEEAFRKFIENISFYTPALLENFENKEYEETMHGGDKNTILSFERSNVIGKEFVDKKTLLGYYKRLRGSQWDSYFKKKIL